MSDVSTPRPVPPMNADERATLEGWLDFYRETLAWKVAGLDDPRLRETSAEPSPLTLLGLVQHLSEVERNWFRRVLAGEDVGPIYPSAAGPDGHDGGFELTEDVTAEQALATWRAEIDHARANATTRALDDCGAFRGAQVSLRWIYVHMIGEYARHDGHADLIRERIDGATGV